MNEQETELRELEKRLTARQRRFVEELEKDGVAYKAAERAGYSKRSAAQQAGELLKNPKVLAYRQARARAEFEALGYGKDHLAMKLCEIVDRCMEKKPVLEWDSAAHAWVESGRWQFDSRGAVRAIEAIAKLQGYYEDKVKISASAESVEEFLKRLGEGGREF